MQRSLVKEVNTLFTYEENAETGTMFGLVTQDLAQIKPNYDSMGKAGLLRTSEDGHGTGK